LIFTQSAFVVALPPAFVMALYLAFVMTLQQHSSRFPVGTAELSSGNGTAVIP
jgi:hypothetical protein